MKLSRSTRLFNAARPARRGAVQIGLMILAYGLSLLAAKLLAKKQKNPLDTDSPTTLAKRGSYTPWWVGIRPVGPVLTWAGIETREIRKEKIEGAGKGGSSPEQDVWYEAGWHVLGVGPVRALNRIIQGGKNIFDQKITSESHPSGTTIDLGKEGSFTIYWGEASQPVNSFLGSQSDIGISSRWPYACYVVWNKKRLGTGPTWPLLEYVLERRPTAGLLANSDPWYEPSRTLTGTSYAITGALSNATETTGYLQVLGDQTADFDPASFIELTGNGLPDGTYEVLKAEPNVAIIGTNYYGQPIYQTSTRIFLQGGTLGANSSGSIETYANDTDDGANAAHVIAEMLFAPFPQGLGLDSDHEVEKWDLDSLEALGEEAETDGWRASLIATDGETVEGLLGATLQDHGTMLPIEPEDGAMLFQRVREPSGTLASLSDSIYADKLPEIETVHGERPVDRLMFAFSDRDHGFTQMTITVDEDGQASYAEHYRAREVVLFSTIHFATAAALTELRSGEEMGQAAEFRLTAGREARGLLPGQAILASGFEEVLLVLGVKVDPLDERVAVSVQPNSYGARKSDFVTGTGGGLLVDASPEQDEQFAVVEIPEYLLGAFPQTQAIVMPRIRANSTIAYASLWLSRDNTTYTLWGTDTTVQTGGVLDDELPGDGPSYVVQGPEFTERGPDNATLSQDLSADLTNWSLGRQLCVIVSENGVEICFLQKATITGGSTRRLDGLLRARYDTRKVTHPAGAYVFIFDESAITTVSDILLEPGEDLFGKTQPGSTNGQVNLAATAPEGIVLYGKGQVPIAPDYVYLRAPFRGSPTFDNGDDITLRWALSTGSRGTGAGMQNSGAAVATPEIPGTVEIDLLTSGDVLRGTIGLDADTLEYELTNAELVSIFLGSEPSSFKVRVRHIANGQSSANSPTLTVTRV